MTVTVQSVSRSVDDAWCHVFQGSNTGYTAQSMILGNFFLGLQAYNLMIFRDLNIPPGSTINSAVLRLIAAANNFTAWTGTSTIVCPTPGPSAAWNPLSFGPAWRREFWGRFAAVVRDASSSANVILDTVPGSTNGAWALKINTTWRQRLAQRVEVPAGPDQTLGSVALQLQRAGAPTGNLFVDVMAEDADGNPDETVLATSDAVLATSVATTPGDITFNFSGGDQITLSGGTNYQFVLRSEYSASATNYIVWHRQSAFFSLDGGRHYGTGEGLDNQNYPGVADVAVLGTSGADVGNGTNWTPPLVVTGGLVDTPNFATTLQTYVNHPNYSPGDSIPIFLLTASAGTNRRWAAEDHPTLAAPRLTVNFSEPRIAPHLRSRPRYPHKDQVRGAAAHAHTFKLSIPFLYKNLNRKARPVYPHKDAIKGGAARSHVFSLSAPVHQFLISRTARPIFPNKDQIRGHAARHHVFSLSIPLPHALINRVARPIYPNPKQLLGGFSGHHVFKLSAPVHQFLIRLNVRPVYPAPYMLKGGFHGHHVFSFKVRVSNICLFGKFSQRIRKNASYQKRFLKNAVFYQRLTKNAKSVKRLRKNAVYQKRLTAEGVFREC